MKKEGEFFGSDIDKNPVGRPRLADKETKRKSLIIATISFVAVLLLIVFGYGTLFGFKSNDLIGRIVREDKNGKKVLITEIKPLVKDITLKENTARKVYLTVLPSSATNKSIKYESMDPSIAEVDKNGKVTALSPGKTKIVATTLDGSNKTAKFNIKVLKDGSGYCSFSSLTKKYNGIDYSINCDNAKVKEIQYSIDDGNYNKLLTKKLNDTVPFSEKQLEGNISFKVIYYPNNSKVAKYKLRKFSGKNVTTTKALSGTCDLTIKEVEANSAKYDVTCENASVSKLAYKIGNGSYVGLDPSSLADTVIFEESDVTRVIYFNVEYAIDGTTNIKSVSKSSVIQAKAN